MVDSLPERPSLEHLRNQAKELLRGLRAADPAALARCQQHGSRFLPPTGASADRAWADKLKLADAQRIIAREYGFGSWTQLKEHVEDARLVANSRADQIDALIGYCLRGELERAERWLTRDSSLAHSHPCAAAAVGDWDGIRSAIQHDEGWVSRLAGPLNAPPLVYACASRFAAPGSPREQGVRQVVAELLQRGADPNSYWLSPETGQAKLSALYGACGINGNAAMADLLLQAGADPNDNESLYHSVEHRSVDCTELLLRHGAKIAGTNAVHNAVGLGNLPALKLLLQYGAAVNEPIMAQHGMTLLHWAIACHQRADVLETLVECGADLRGVALDGKSPYRRAALSGHGVAVELLQRHGVTEALSADEELLSACMMGDSERLVALMSARPPGVSRWLEACGEHLFTAAWNGNERAVRAMMAIGCDVARGNHRRATALHAAAWKGWVELVELLVAAGAPLSVRETQFDCTPLEWALHGSCHCGDRLEGESAAERDGRYARAVARLLAFESPRPVDRLVRICRGAVAEVLEGAGITVDEDGP